MCMCVYGCVRVCVCVCVCVSVCVHTYCTSTLPQSRMLFKTFLRNLYFCVFHRSACQWQVLRVSSDV